MSCITLSRKVVKEYYYCFLLLVKVRYVIFPTNPISKDEIEQFGYKVLHITVVNHYIIVEKRRSIKDILTYVVLPMIGLLIIGFVWIGLAPEAKTLGFIWLAIGVAYLAVITRGFKKIPPALQV